jgi:hypothetical protein
VSKKCELQNLKGRGYFGELNTDGRMILKYILNKHGVIVD